MAIQNWRSFWLTIFFVVLIFKLDRARSLRISTFHPINGPDEVGSAGICESLVTVHGYPCIEYLVTTEDGYVLSLQRIPHGRVNGSGVAHKQPVLLQHGVLSDGITWLLLSPDESLAFILADSGYDLWIANSRGTRWSREHTSLDAKEPAYWNWSWDELVEYDLPAVLDFVYEKTGQKVDYVGHSLGTLIALASFSQGKLTDRIKAAALLSPIAYLSSMTTVLGQLASKAFLGEFTAWLGIAEFNPKGKVVEDFLKTLCSNPTVDCYDLMTAFTGKNCCLNESTVELSLKYEPQSTATKNMVHLAQTVRDGIVRKFDYGNVSTNEKMYGQSTPPVYNMSSIPNDLPLFLSYGGQDALADPTDVGHLLDDLKFHDGDKLTVQFVKDYAHADFVMGVTAKKIVYNALISFFSRQL